MLDNPVISPERFPPRKATATHREGLRLVDVANGEFLPEPPEPWMAGDPAMGNLGLSGVNGSNGLHHCCGIAISVGKGWTGTANQIFQKRDHQLLRYLVVQGKNPKIEDT